MNWQVKFQTIHSRSVNNAKASITVATVQAFEHAQRQAVIAANAELRERELIKLASLSAALADGLRRRGVPDPDASLAAEAGIAVYVRGESGKLAAAARSCPNGRRCTRARRRARHR